MSRQRRGIHHSSPAKLPNHPLFKASLFLSQRASHLAVAASQLSCHPTPKAESPSFLPTFPLHLQCGSVKQDLIDLIPNPHLCAHRDIQAEHTRSEAKWPSVEAEPRYQKELWVEDQEAQVRVLALPLTLRSLGLVTAHSDHPLPHCAKREPAHRISRLSPGLEIPVYSQGTNSINEGD